MNEMELNALTESETYVTSSKSTIAHFLNLNADGQLNLNPDYQRPYVYTEPEQQALLLALIKGLPLDHISIVINQAEIMNENYCIVVDGKQRLTTFFLFFSNKIPLIMPVSGEHVYFSDLPKIFQKKLKLTTFPVNELHSTSESKSVSYIEQVRYFYSVNFAGVPQSPEHKEKILDILNKHNEKTLPESSTLSVAPDGKVPVQDLTEFTQLISDNKPLLLQCKHHSGVYDKFDYDSYVMRDIKKFIASKQVFFEA
jgi:uncharacterized protein with ParB-like and HNH nuclease domain